MTSASTGSAVHDACVAARQKLVELAIADSASPLHNATIDSIRVENETLSVTGDNARKERFIDILTRQPNATIEVKTDSAPNPEAQKYAMHSFGAVFTEVHVDQDLGEVRVPRIVAAYGVGNILNMKTALSQLYGGIVWGVGMALHEHTLIDARTARYMNADLAEYHVPVNADIGNLDVTFVDEHDSIINPIGVKGIGEIGITGAAASIANAIFNATGVRVRDLPITLDKIISATASRPTS